MIIKILVSHLNLPINLTHVKGGIVKFCVYPDVL